MNLTERLRADFPAQGPAPDADALLELFTEWCADPAGGGGVELYPHQEEAIVDLLTGAHTIVTTPTGSGKSLIATAALLSSLAAGGRGWYTAPIKALVSEKFFAMAHIFGAANVGMVTGDGSVNAEAPIIVCTAEILANVALRTSPGEAASVAHTVVMDEFHYIADPDRGWAWQATLTELPASQMLLMSATLGDTTALAEGMERRTGRSVAVVSQAERPVPLAYRWAGETTVPETITELIENAQTPVYVVHASQRDAVERAQALVTAGVVPAARRAQIQREVNEAIGHFRFSPGFGKTLQQLVRAGIGVHHAGMLPKYRRLVETLAQKGLLPVICGTDTLGVGINVPIRTVLFSQLTKFDGRRQRVLRAREFHQIAGRAGRAGYDTIGHVVAQAPDFVIENHKALAKVGDDPKRQRGVRRKKAPEGFITWTEQTFERLIDAPPETLIPRMRITNAMLLNLLQRDQNTLEAAQRLIDESTPDRGKRLALYRRALELGRSMLASGTVVRLAEPTPGGRRFALSPDLQDDFALNQPLSSFALAAFDLLDADSAEHSLDLVSVVEATLDNPTQVLWAQQARARGEAVAEMKAEGLDYEERRDAADEIGWPEPLGELLEQAFEVYRQTHPWLSPADLNPKSVVRDMIERAMTFGEYVAFHKVQRSEGLLLRYLSDAYRALRQTVPESLATPEFDDLVDWLGEVIRLTDSSLLDEWEALAHPDDAPARDAAPPPPRPLTANERAFRVLVRNAMWRRVQLIADDDPDGLADLDGPDATFRGDDWDDALGRYYDEHHQVLLDADARGPALLQIEVPRAASGAPRRWLVDQIVSDPASNHDWQIHAVVDLDASDEAEQLVLRVVSFDRL